MLLLVLFSVKRLEIMDMTLLYTKQFQCFYE